MDTLIINSYAGSLVLGARAAGHSIRGSYEDGGFGQDAQRANFPDLDFVKDHPWPKQDLRDTIVISHPPCAAFSNQNSSKAKKGTNTSAFQCHRNVMKYAFENNCVALAIESVPGAIAAANEYASTADKYGYDHVFIELNAISFGVPQWRPRMWTLFFRRDLGLKHFNAWFNPTFKSIGEIVYDGEVDDAPYVPGEGGGDKHAGPGRMIDALVARARKQIADFDDFVASDNVGNFGKAYSAWKEIKIEDWAAMRAIVGPGWFATMLPRKLALNSWAPVLMHQSFWYINNRPANRVEYQRIMGFPDNFVWPEKMKPHFRLFLSKGVCPPVAQWIATQLQDNVGGKPWNDQTPTLSCAWGEVLNLEPKKADVQAYLDDSPTAMRKLIAPSTSYIRKIDMTPAINGETLGECHVDECKDIPQEVFEKIADAAPMIVNVPKPFAKYVFFAERPVDGATYKYNAAAGAMEKISVVSFDRDEVVATVAKRAPRDTSKPRNIPSPEERLARANATYYQVDGVKSEDFKERSHGYAIIRAMELNPTVTFTQTQLIAYVEQNPNLIETTMKIDAAIKWMLNKLVKEGKVKRCNV